MSPRPRLHRRRMQASLAELTGHFDWWDATTYDIDPPGRNHGLLLATIRWRP